MSGQTSPPASTPTASTPPASTASAAPVITPAMIPDWPNLKRYAAENESLPPPARGEKRVVFFGDSITEAWGRRPGTGEFFPGRPYVNRGISGQTTAQLLVRFEQDVVHLRPAAVVILAGINDIAGNTGPATDGMIQDNFRSMVAIGKANGIRVVLASLTPADHFPWRPGIAPAARIRSLNEWMKGFCAQSGIVFLDYYSAMRDEGGAMLPGYSTDGVHPLARGYAVMTPLAEQAIAKALSR